MAPRLWCCWSESFIGHSRTWYPVLVEEFTGKQYILVRNASNRSEVLREYLARQVNRPLVLSGDLAGTVDAKKGFNISTRAREENRELLAAGVRVSASLVPTAFVC